MTELILAAWMVTQNPYNPSYTKPLNHSALPAPQANIVIIPQSDNERIEYDVKQRRDGSYIIDIERSNRRRGGRASIPRSALDRGWSRRVK